MSAHLHAADIAAVVATVDPDANGVGAVTSDWVDAANFHSFLAIVQTGVLGTSATVDFKLQQATDASGTSAKDITGAAITQLVKASNDDDQAVISILSDVLDTDNDFTHVAMVLTVGTATSDCGAVLLGVHPRTGPAEDNDLASVVEIVRA